MKELLTDMVRQVAPLFDKVRITGGDSGLHVEAHTEDKMLFLVADLPGSMPELAGEFGISNLQLLKGLLEFPLYKAETAKFQVQRVVRDDLDYVSELEFKDGQGGYARFKTINPRMIGDRAKIAEISWGVSVMPSKAKLTEVMQLTGMLTQVDQHFAVSYENRTLLLTIGGKAATNHNATVALATGIDCGPLPSKMVFKAAHFVSVLKNVGNWPCAIRFVADGVGGVLIETDHGAYNYVLRGTES
jgi:hypothetical protein